MSNALAIATVTTALAQIVRSAVQSVVTGSDVHTGRPDPNATPSHRVHLFLYQVSPNGAMRNSDIPTRAADGSLVTRPTVALDLHYLLAFYGNDSELESQRMLGAVVRDLHSKPVLTRQMITDAVGSQPFLSSSNLSEAVEQVKFTPIPMSLEEMSKLWSVFFQTPYALSVAYQGTVILIQSEEGAALPLPVLMRGEADRGAQVLLGSFPALERIHVCAPEDADLRPRPQSYAGAQLGSMLILSGQNLSGDSLTVRFRHPRLPLPKEMPVPENARTANEVRVTIRDDAAAQTEWAAGLYSVTVVAKSGSTDRESNRVPLVLTPRIKNISPNPAQRDAAGTAKLTIVCSPKLLPKQSAELLISDRVASAEAHPASTDTVQFVLKNAPVIASALARLRVDGVDSLPFKRQAVPAPPRLVFDDQQRATIQ